MAPMAFFHTELLDVTGSGRHHSAGSGSGRVRMMPDKNEGDPEDPHDDLVDTVTNRKQIKVRTVCMHFEFGGHLLESAKSIWRRFKPSGLA